MRRGYRWLIAITAALTALVALPCAALAVPATGWGIESTASPTNLPPSIDQVDEVTIDAGGGTFTLTYASATTSALHYNASAGEVQGALEALTAIGAHNVKVSGGPGGVGGTSPYRVTFEEALGGKSLAGLTVNGGSLLVGAGQALTCDAGPASAAKVSYQWLSDGEPIFGETSSAYTVGLGESAAAIQCETTAENGEAPAAGSVAVSRPALLAIKAPASSLPEAPASVAAPSGTVAAGETLTCSAGSWTGASSYDYEWLRNGAVVASTTGSAATTNTYKLTSADVATPASFQCIVTGVDTAGAVSAASALASTSPAPSPLVTASASVAPLAEAKIATAGATGSADYWLSVANNGALASTGTVTVVDRLPSGVETSATPTGSEGWSCSPTGAGQTYIICTNSKSVPADTTAYAIKVPVTVPVVPEGTTLVNDATVSGGGASESASATEHATVTSAAPQFGAQTLSAQLYNEEGKIYTQAGGHAYAATASWHFTTNVHHFTLESVKTVEVELPPGIIGNPASTPRCFTLKACPVASQVGDICLDLQEVKGIPGGSCEPIYNMVPPKDMAAEFKFPTLSPTVTIFARVRSNGNYGLTVYSEDLAEVYAVEGVRVTLWGTPNSESHEPDRNPTLVKYIGFTGFATNMPEAPFFSDPTDCASEAQEPPVTTIKADSWQKPEVWHETSSTAPAVTGCGLLSFDPQISFEPATSQAGQPTGYGFDLKVPQAEVTGGLATPELRDTTVTLPAGIGVSPSATGGLTDCSEGQIALHSLEAGQCPLSSQVATVAVWTPLLSTQPALQLTGIQTGELECASGEWSGVEAGHPFQYRWLRDGAVIPGAEGVTYLPSGAEDEGKAIQCEVFAGNANGSTAAVSGTEVTKAYPSPLPPSDAIAPKVQGGNSAGATDTCTTGSWTGEVAGYAYQWLRGGEPIAGAESSGYALTGEDAGRVLQCEVTATNAGGNVVALSVPQRTVSPQPTASPPLIEAPLTGRVYVAEPECSPCSSTDVAEGKLIGLYLEAYGKGVRVKLHGDVAVNPANGQLTAHFDETPQLPFEELQLNFKNGPRAPLANPQKCGQYTASTNLEPWSAPEDPDATPSSSYGVSFDGAGEACPSSLPFAPTFTAGTISPVAAGSSNFAATFERPRAAHESEERSEQDFAGIQVSTPPGLLGKLTGVPLCEEPQASQGTCPAASQIGTTTVATGPGAHPLHLQGQVYLTSSYNGAPFGLSIVVPAEAGPFKLAGTTGRGTVVVRAAITINPETAALTITAEPLPQVIDGVILRLQQANVEVTRPNFMINATNCSQQAITATITGAEGARREFSEPYAASGCANLAFTPKLTASTQAKTSRHDGASLHVSVTYPGEGQANIKYVKVELPKQLPSRLNTLQHACLAATFQANPAGCPAESVVGTVKALTPVLPVALTGPAYFVSEGAQWPELIVVLQGDGVRIDLTGTTFISKKGITSSTFATVPDAPVQSFELTLPEGPYSALAANKDLCKTKLSMPTTIEGQNGKRIKQKTKIAVSGCPRKKAKKAAVKVLKTKVHKHRGKQTLAKTTTRVKL